MAEKMTPKDAALWLAEHDEDWKMPEEYWYVNAGDDSYHVSEEIATKLLVGSPDLLTPNNHYYSFVDIYGARCYISVLHLLRIFQSTKAIRMRWIAGVPVRNWKDDSDDEGDEWRP